MTRRFIPHDYQRPAMDHLYGLRRCGLFAPMGGGKTVMTLTALVNLNYVEDVFPVLVLAPLRVANTTWPDEVAKWEHLSHLRVSMIAGRRDPDTSATAKERLRALSTPADVYTMNYDGLQWLVETLGDDWPFRTVVADELSRLKSFRIRQGSKRAASLGKVAHTKVERFIGLTGTPSANGLKDLWGQLWFIDKGGRLGKTFSAFEARWFARGYDGYSLVPQPWAQTDIQAAIKDVCLTVEGLPVDEPIWNTIYVDLPRKARELYKAMEKHAFAQIEGRDVSAVQAVVKTNKLLQLSNGAVYVDRDSGKDLLQQAIYANDNDESSPWEAVHEAKLDALESVIEEAAGAPVLVAYHFKSDLARILKRFPQARQLDADPDTIREWNAGRVPVLVAHPACLHPATEVLTEFRGWVPIVDVDRYERVFDGVEFVSHSGCSFSGVKEVLEVFGVKMTAGHKLLVGGEWMEAAYVRNNPGLRGKAAYSYAGDDAYLGSMLPVRRGAGSGETARRAGKPYQAGVLPGVLGKFVPSDDRDAVLLDLERDEGSRNGPGEQGLPEIRRGWARYFAILVEVRKLLQRHVWSLFRGHDHRTDGQHEGVQQAELPLGDEHGAAGQQEQQSRDPLRGARRTSRGTVPVDGPWALWPFGSPECRHDRRRSGAGFPRVSVSEKSPVFDLVDCGPRNRFLIRNAQGEVFISHNSAGHGLNLQYGGNILAFFGVGWNLEEYLQIIERIGPLRQKQAGLDRPVFVHHILARDTMDDVVMERLRDKRTVQEVLLEALKRRKETEAC